MAKFRNGNLVLTSSQAITQGSTTVLSTSRVGWFSGLKLDSALTTVINEFSTDGTLSGNSDTALPTEKAVRTYVNNKIAGSIGAGTDNVIARYDGTSNIQQSGITIDDSNNVTGVVALTATGKITGNTFGVINADLVSVTSTVKSAGYFYAGTTTPTDTTRINFDGEIYATTINNAVWNDVADFQDLADSYIPGLCYYDTQDGAYICYERCQKAVIGILSDTYGISLGSDENKAKGPFAVCGWVLAYMDDQDTYECGDVLTNNEKGQLCKMTDAEKALYPERIVATYKKVETGIYWGTDQKRVLVNHRHWVKIK